MVRPIAGRAQLLEAPGLRANGGEVAGNRFGHILSTRNLTGGRQNETGARAQGEAQSILGAPTPDRTRLKGAPKNARRRGRAREVRNDIDRHGQLRPSTHIGLDEAQSPVAYQIGDVVQISGRQIIYTDDDFAAPNECVAQV